MMRAAKTICQAMVRSHPIFLEPDAVESDAASPQLDDEFKEGEREDKKPPRRRVSVSLRGLVIAAVIGALVCAVGVLGGFTLDSTNSTPRLVNPKTMRVLKRAHSTMR